MNGPDHYEEAEHLLNSTQDQAGNYQNSPNLTAALTHAVLALAAATALNDTDPDGPIPGAAGTISTTGPSPR